MGSGVMLLREIMAFLLLLHGRVEFPLFFFKPIVGFSKITVKTEKKGWEIMD
jgi:hypothetical protein